MEITEAVLRRTAHLARLELTPEEAKRYKRELSAVLEAMAALAAVPTDGVPAEDLPPVDAAATRPDRAETRRRSQDLVEGAPDHVGRYVRLKGGAFSP